MKPTVALIHGGEGYEHDISLLGAKNLSAMICREKYEVIPVLIDKNGNWLTDGGKTQVFPVLLGKESGLLSERGLLRLDIAIPLLHGDRGEDGAVIGALKSAHIKFIGCDILPSALTADKISAKLIARALGIPTADFVFSTDADRDGAVERAEKALTYPMFVKPSGLGSSIGISKAYDKDGLIRAYENALKYSKRILIENTVEVKRELECAFADFGGKRFITPPGEVLIRGFYDFDKKYGGETEVETSAKVPDGIKKQAIAYSELLTKVLGVRHLGRVDFFLSDDGNLYFNEINPIPGMTGESLYLKLLKKAGIGEGDFLRYAVRSLGGVSL